MARQRDIAEIIPAAPTVEGAGVRLKRAFGHAHLPRFDPFLMLDDFHSDRPADYQAGFPWHPHRGIETITYMLRGHMEHGDSLGNQGIIGPGDVQWMTAGSGIIHQELPVRTDAESTLLWGFQLWANLPAELKMTAPRYRDVRGPDIPSVETGEGVVISVICGEVAGMSGPVSGISIAPEYLDVTFDVGASLSHMVAPGRSVFAYVIEGQLAFGPDQIAVGPESTVRFGEGDAVSARAGKHGARLLLVSGTPLNEPVAWGGPIVMNTDAELQQAMREYREGTFVRESAAPDRSG